MNIDDNLVSSQNHNQQDPRLLSIEEAIANDSKFSISEMISEGWSYVNGSKMNFFIGGLIVGLIQMCFGMFLFFLEKAGLDILSSGFNILLSAVVAVISVGFLFLVQKRLDSASGGTTEYFFKTKPFIANLFIANLLQMIFITIGLVFLVIPGIYLMVALSLTNWVLISYPETSPMQAIKISMKVVNKRFFSLLGLFIVLGVILMISAIPFGIGLIWTFPLSALSVGIVFRKIFYR